MISFYKKLKYILPPFFIIFLKKNIGYIGYAIWEYAPKGFNTKIKNGGWNLESIANLQVQKWGEYSKRATSIYNLGFNHENPDANIQNDPFSHNLLVSFAYVITLSGLKKKSINFLDWGGGIGHYGLLAEQLIKEVDIELNYYCFDFPVFCKHGKILNPSFNFFSDHKQFLDCKFDLVMASSSIWYERDWKMGIDKLCAYSSNFLYITRMIFINNQPSYVALQRPKLMGYNTEYLFWVINKSDFISYLNEKKYSLVREFDFGDIPPIFKAPEQGTMQGYLFVKRG